MIKQVDKEAAIKAVQAAIKHRDFNEPMESKRSRKKGQDLAVGRILRDHLEVICSVLSEEMTRQPFTQQGMR